MAYCQWQARLPLFSCARGVGAGRRHNYPFAEILSANNIPPNYVWWGKDTHVFFSEALNLKGSILIVSQKLILKKKNSFFLNLGLYRIGVVRNILQKQA